MDFRLPHHKTILLGKHQFQKSGRVVCSVLSRADVCVCVCVVKYLPQGLHRSPSGGELEGQINRTIRTSVLLQAAAGEAERLTALSLLSAFSSLLDLPVTLALTQVPAVPYRHTYWSSDAWKSAAVGPPEEKLKEQSIF